MSALSNGQLKVTLTVDKTLTHLQQSLFQTKTLEQPKHSQTFGGKSLAFSDNEDEEDHTANDLSSYESAKMKQQLKDNLSALDMMTRKFKQSL